MQEAMPMPSNLVENKSENEAEMPKSLWNRFREKVSGYSFENSKLGEMKNWTLEKIEKLNHSEKLKMFGGLAKIGSSIDGFKNNFMANASTGLSNAFENKHLKAFFEEKAKKYEERMVASYQDAENKDAKDMTNLKGIGKLAGNFLRFGRVVSDVTQANPFRHVMATSMFIGDNAEDIKKVRLRSESVLKKTRVGSDERDEEGNLIDEEGYERAWEEANRLYEQAQAKNGDGAVTAESLDKAYEHNLPKDIIERFRRNENYEGSNFLKKGMDWHMKRSAGKIEKELKKIEMANLTPEEKERQTNLIISRNQKLLQDLDGMVSDQGAVDTFSYLARVAEKSGKTVATAMTVETAIESIPRLAKLVGRLGASFGDWISASEAYGDESLKIDPGKEFLEMKAFRDQHGLKISDGQLEEMSRSARVDKEWELLQKRAGLDKAIGMIKGADADGDGKVEAETPMGGFQAEYREEGGVKYYKVPKLPADSGPDRPDAVQSAEQPDAGEQPAAAMKPGAKSEAEFNEARFVGAKTGITGEGDADSDYHYRHKEEFGNKEESRNFEIDENVKIKPGDSVWSVAKKYLGSNEAFQKLASSGGKDLAESLETHNIDRVKDLIAADPAKYGLSAEVNIDKLSLDDLKAVKWQEAFNDAFKEKGITSELTDAQVNSILENNAELKKFFAQNPFAPRSSANYEAILRGEGATGESEAETPRINKGIKDDWAEGPVPAESEAADEKTPEPSRLPNEEMNERFSEGIFHTQKQFGEEWSALKDMPAEDALEAEVSRWSNHDAFARYLEESSDSREPYAGGQLDYVELANRERMQSLLREAQERIGAPAKDESIEKYLQRYYGAEKSGENAGESDLAGKTVDNDVADAAGDKIDAKRGMAIEDAAKRQAYELFDAKAGAEARMEKLIENLEEHGQPTKFSEEIIGELKNRGVRNFNKTDEDYIAKFVKNLYSGNGAEKLTAKNRLTQFLKDIEDKVLSDDERARFENAGSGEKSRRVIDVMEEIENADKPDRVIDVNGIIEETEKE